MSEKKPAKRQDFAEKEAQIVSNLKRDQIQTDLKVYIEVLRRTAELETF